MLNSAVFNPHFRHKQFFKFNSFFFGEIILFAALLKLLIVWLFDCSYVIILKSIFISHKKQAMILTMANTTMKRDPGCTESTFLPWPGDVFKFMFVLENTESLFPGALILKLEPAYQGKPICF